MAASAERLMRATADSRPAPPDPALRALLRDLARDVQLCAPLDLDRGCALIAADPAASLRARGVVLLRAIDAAALRPVVFHRGAGAAAFGEAWLLRLIESLRDGDEASAAFLVARLIRRERRRAVLWLARRFAEALDATAPRAEAA